MVRFMKMALLNKRFEWCWGGPEENMVPLVSSSNVFAICAIWQRFQHFNPKAVFILVCNNALMGIDQPWKSICWRSQRWNFTEETWFLWSPTLMSSQSVQFGSDFNILTQKPSLAWFATHSIPSREEKLHWWHTVFLFYSILRWKDLDCDGFHFWVIFFSCLGYYGVRISIQ